MSTKPVHLSLATVLLSLGAVLQKSGTDHVYVNPAHKGTAPNDVGNVCDYKHADGSPGCIVGEVLTYNNVPLPNVGEPGAGSYAASLFEYLKDAGLVTTEPLAVALLSEIQREQDKIREKEDDGSRFRCTWGEAVANGIKNTMAR